MRLFGTVNGAVGHNDASEWMMPPFTGPYMSSISPQPSGDTAIRRESCIGDTAIRRVDDMSDTVIRRNPDTTDTATRRY